MAATAMHPTSIVQERHELQFNAVDSLVSRVTHRRLDQFLSVRRRIARNDQPVFAVRHDATIKACPGDEQGQVPGGHSGLVSNKNENFESI